MSLWKYLVIVVRIGCSDQLSQDEVISIIYSSPLRLNVSVFPTLFNYKSSLLLKEFIECASGIFLGKLFHGVAILLRRKCVLGSFPDVRLERAGMDVFGLLYFYLILVFCFHCTSLPYLDRVQSCKSLWNRLFRVLFSGLSNLVFRVFLRKAGGVILSWCEHFLKFLSRILDGGSRLMNRILGVTWRLLDRWFVLFHLAIS